MGALRMRPATAADWPALWAIIRPILVAGETYAAPPEMPEAAAREVFLDSPTAVFVAESHDGVLGFYYLRPNQPGLGDHIANAGYMTDQGARGRGVGRALGEHSLAEAARRGFRAMQYNLVVATNSSAIALWQSLGFAIIGTIPDAFRHRRLGLVDAHIMYRALDGEHDGAEET